MPAKNHDDYLATIDRMEPEICSVDLTAAAASISISLKRIADTLEWFKKEAEKEFNKTNSNVKLL